MAAAFLTRNAVLCCFKCLFLVRNTRMIKFKKVFRELETLGIHIRGVINLRSERHVHDPTKDGPLTPHFIMAVSWGPEVFRVSSPMNPAACR